MKVLIRPMVFETNSSSTCSYVLLNDADYKAFAKGKLYKVSWNDELHKTPTTGKELAKMIRDLRLDVNELNLSADMDIADILQVIKDYMWDTGWEIYLNLEEYFQDAYASKYEIIDDVQTINGKPVHIIGYYGNGY